MATKENINGLFHYTFNSEEIALLADGIGWEPEEEVLPDSTHEINSKKDLDDLFMSIGIVIQSIPL